MGSEGSADTEGLTEGIAVPTESRAGHSLVDTTRPAVPGAMARNRTLRPSAEREKEPTTLGSVLYGKVASLVLRVW
jgi:hypothetical protein